LDGCFQIVGRSRRTSTPIFINTSSILANQSTSTYKMPSPVHIISKIGDPIFAVFIGLSAAATRINREEKELGRSTQQTINAGLRYAVEEFWITVFKLTLVLNRRIGFPRQGDVSSKKN
jgi:non-classical export protein 1